MVLLAGACATYRNDSHGCTGSGPAAAIARLALSPVAATPGRFFRGHPAQAGLPAISWALWINGPYYVDGLNTVGTQIVTMGYSGSTSSAGWRRGTVALDNDVP